MNRGLPEAPNPSRDDPSDTTTPALHYSHTPVTAGAPPLNAALLITVCRPPTPRELPKQHGRLPLSQCLEIGRHLASALAHLHAQGLVHRDVKPSNIIFVGGVPKLADIGLVADVSEA